jgi:hypothetical protein
MAHSPIKYYCKLCQYGCGQKSHIDSHKITTGHMEKCNNMIATLKTNKSLYSKYIAEMNINEDDDKTMHMLRQEIIDKLSTIYKQNVDLEEIEYVPKIVITNTKKEPQLELIHELTQFTHGKTEQTLNKIGERYLLNSISTDAHIIQIIVTNKSLGETKQWKIRTRNKMNEYENIDVDILSSDVKSEYHNIDKFISKIMKANTRNELPNILIVCFHKKRIEDILTLFQMFCGKTIMIQNVKLRFNLSFDEPDANCGLCSTFLKKYKEYMNLIETIEFITASPYSDFWTMLQKNGIFQLTNPHKLDQDCIDGETYEEYLDNYRQIKDHVHLVCNYSTNNPLEYIEHVFSNTYITNDVEGNKIAKSYVDMTDSARKIIFSPAHLFTEKEGVGSHEEVVKFYNELGFTVYLSNGKFKGFVEPTGERITLDDFNTVHKITGELRDTMRKWATTYPEKNIAITGYWTIERGITFQTDGFNFTHAIISDYHKQLLNKLVQLIGRITGNKRYIETKCNLICPQHIIDTVNTLVNKTIELRKENPENYNATDFTDKNSSIPVKLTFTDDEYRLLCVGAITHKRNYKQHLHSLLKSGYQSGKIILEDRNNIHIFTNDKKDKSGNTKIFDDIHKHIANVKMYTSTNKSIHSRRFAQFNNAFNLYKPTSQTGEVGEYSIDLAKDRYEYNGFVNEVNIAWITFRHD